MGCWTLTKVYGTAFTSSNNKLIWANVQNCQICALYQVKRYKPAVVVVVAGDCQLLQVYFAAAAAAAAVPVAVAWEPAAAHAAAVAVVAAVGWLAVAAGRSNAAACQHW